MMPTKRRTTGSPQSDQGTASGVQARVDALQQDMSQVKLALSTVLGFEQVTVALSEIAEQLQPLRELRSEPPLGQDLDRPTIRALRSLRTALARPDWSGVGSLSVADKDVGFIGQVESNQQSSDRPAQRGGKT